MSQHPDGRSASERAAPDGPPSGAAGWRPRIGLFLGPSLFFALLLLEPQVAVDSAPWRVLALTALMAVWWVSEAVPISITALLPLILLPFMGVVPIDTAAAPYANPLVFLFFGGFLIAAAIQRWDLHRRIALLILDRVGARLDFLIGGFMAATAGLSMWVSNTATAALMLPIALSVLDLLDARAGPDESRRTALAMLLGIAFAANIGGMATLIGTPPNALLAGYLADNHEIEIGFAQWMLVAAPPAMVLLMCAWWVLTRWIYPVAHQEIPGIGELIMGLRAELGPVSGAERRVAVIFALVALAWMARPALEAFLPGITLSDPGIALLGGLALFLVPVDWRRFEFLMDWRAAAKVPWGVLVLVGGGLSLGAAIEISGLANLVADALALFAGWPTWVLVGLIATVTLLLSHVTSNTATAATLLPLATALAYSMELPPLLLAVPVALAASCAFMLPVATPPNAIIFGSERVTIPDMVRAGALLSLLGVVLVTGAVLLLALPVLGGGV